MEKGCQEKKIATVPLIERNWNFQEKKLFAIQVECQNPVDPREGVDILTVNQQTIWSSPSKQSRGGGGENWLSVKLATGKLFQWSSDFVENMFPLALYVLQH